MKNLLKVLFAFALIAMTISSCTKESQKCINKLEGSWDITKFEVTDSSGTTYDYVTVITMMGGTFTGTMEFEKYDRNEEDYGTGSQSIVMDVMGSTENINTNFQYALSEDCTTMMLTDQATNTALQMSINELSSNSFELTGTDGDGGSFKFQIERQ